MFQKKFNLIICVLMLFLSFIVCSSCNDDAIDLKEIYENNIDLARDHLGGGQIVFVSKKNFDKSQYNQIKDMIGYDFKSLIAQKLSTGQYNVIACEFKIMKLLKTH